MRKRNNNKDKPVKIQYQKIFTTILWVWAGITSLPIFLSGLSNFAILSKWITLPITIIGSILLVGFILGSPIYLKSYNVIRHDPKTGKDERLKTLDAKTIFTSLGILFALWIPRINEQYIPPKPQAVDIRIVMTNFISFDKDVSNSIAQNISQEVYTSIENNLEEVENEYGKLEIELLPPSRIPTVYGQTLSEIETNIQSIAEIADADIVIYGILTKDNASNSADIELFFYLNEDSTFGFPEFIGQDTWSSEIKYPLGNDPQSSFERGELLGEISTYQGKALAYSIYGVWKYSVGEYETSAELFEKSTKITPLKDTKGLSVWYLWWGNATLKQQDFTNAHTYYQNALDLRPGYARAFIGLAETTISWANYFLADKGLENAHQFIDTTNIFLENALSASDRPASADIDIKVESILGRIAQMKYYYFAPPDPALLDEAEKHYKYVIFAYESNNRRVVEQAGLSFMHLGEIYMARQEYTLSKINFESALKILGDKHAIELTLSNLSKLPIVNPLQAQSQLATAIAIATDDIAKEEYKKRIQCWNAYPTPIPQDSLICIK